MADGLGILDIVDNRRFEDYQSMKQWFRYEPVREVILRMPQTSTVSFVEVQEAGGLTIARLSAADQIYIRSEADLAGLDGKYIYTQYLTSTGVIKTVKSLLNIAGGAGTDHEMPLGNENLLDVVNGAPAGAAVTLTNLTATLNAWAGKYLVVYSGDQEGVSSLIVSNTAAAGGVVVTTVKDDWAANMASDLVSIQSYPCADVFRIRKMWAESESPANNYQKITNAGGTTDYYVIQDGRKAAAHSMYFVPAASECTSYLGRIKCRAQVENEGDAVEAGYQITVTYTPDNYEAVDITETFTFMDFLDEQPCIKLKPATDVIFTMKKITNTDHHIVHVETTILEVHLS